jgi:tetratricopeptide (TPR) repeat protein
MKEYRRIFKKGERYRRKKKYIKALRTYHRCITINDKDPQLWNNLATVYNLIGNYDQAIIASRKALKLTKIMPEALDNIIHAYSQLGESEKAVDFLNQYKNLKVDINPNGIIIIDDYFSYFLGENQLKIEENFKGEGKAYLNFLIIIPLLVCIPVILLFYLYYDQNLLLSLITFLIADLPFIICYIYYRNRKTDCFLDNSTKLILYRNISPRYKQLRVLNFSDINFILFTGSKSSWEVNLSFQLYSNERVKITEYFDFKIKKLGLIISEFLDVPFYIKTSEGLIQQN